MLFQLLALLILFAFYAVYLGKMLLQRKKGIQTNQIAKGQKPQNVMRIEILMKIATYLIIPVQLICIFTNASLLSDGFRIAGVVLSVLGDIVFTVSVIEMRDSWRAGIPENDQTALVTEGIYRFSRNPAFLGFDLLYLGILLMFFDWTLFAFSLFAILMLHLQILQEEEYLKATFGQSYLDYQKVASRYFGKRSFRVTIQAR